MSVRKVAAVLSPVTPHRLSTRGNAFASSGLSIRSPEPPPGPHDYRLREMADEGLDRAIGASVDVDRHAVHHGVEALTSDSRRVYTPPGGELADLRACPGHVVEFTQSEAGADSRHMHAVWSPLVRERFRKLDRERFGRGVERVARRRRHEARQRGDVDDATIAAFDHA